MQGSVRFGVGRLSVGRLRRDGTLTSKSRVRLSYGHGLLATVALTAYFKNWKINNKGFLLLDFSYYFDLKATFDCNFVHPFNVRACLFSFCFHFVELYFILHYFIASRLFFLIYSCNLFHSCIFYSCMFDLLIWIFISYLLIHYLHRIKHNIIFTVVDFLSNVKLLLSLILCVSGRICAPSIRIYVFIICSFISIFIYDSHFYLIIHSFIHLPIRSPRWGGRRRPPRGRRGGAWSHWRRSGGPRTGLRTARSPRTGRRGSAGTCPSFR